MRKLRSHVFRILNMNGFTDEDREQKKSFIYFQIKSDLVEITRNMYNLDIEYGNESLKVGRYKEMTPTTKKSSLAVQIRFLIAIIVFRMKQKCSNDIYFTEMLILLPQNTLRML